MSLGLNPRVIKELCKYYQNKQNKINKDCGLTLNVVYLLKINVIGRGKSGIFWQRVRRQQLFFKVSNGLKYI